jgi:hypothetical protein
LALCGAVVSCTAVWSSLYACRHPDSLIGRVMKGASNASAALNPLGGFGPVLAKLDKKEEMKAHPDEVEENVPPDPEPLDPVKPAVGDLRDGEPAAAPIVIPDDDEPQTRPVIRPVDHESFGPETECPAAAVCRAPAVMPSCQDEEECEVLPMPAVEEEGEEQEADEGCPHGCITHQIFRFMSRLAHPEPAAQTTPEEKAGEGPCRHDVRCPNSGRPAGACPVPPQPACKPAGEEPSEDGAQEQSSCKAAQKRLERIKARKVIDEWQRATYPISPNVDTLEMRPSDRPKYDYGPGPL